MYLDIILAICILLVIILSFMDPNLKKDSPLLIGIVGSFVAQLFIIKLKHMNIISSSHV